MSLFETDLDRYPRQNLSTGAAAAAAAVAATMILAGKGSPQEVRINIADGQEHSLIVKIDMAVMLNSDEAMAIVTKDAPDTPDITNGAEVGAIVRRLSSPRLVQIIGGVGIGKVTRPGLAVPPGEWAINPAPRKMIADNIQTFLGTHSFPGAQVEIFVEKGEALAAQTLNHRLGIIGGISILENTGTSRPFSHEAYVATIDASLEMAKSAGLEELVFCPGVQSEKIAIQLNPKISVEGFIQIADFFSDSLRLAAAKHFKKVSFNLFFDKAVNLAFGITEPQSNKAVPDISQLAQWLAPDEISLAEQIRKAKSLRLIFDVLCSNNAISSVEVVAKKALQTVRLLSNYNMDLEVVILHYDGRVLGKTSATKAPQADKQGALNG